MATMTRRSKILLTGCATPLLLICLCGVAIYFQPNLVAPVLERFGSNESAQVLEDLAENPAEPAIDWDVLEEAGQEQNDGQAASGSALPPPAVEVTESDVVRVRVGSQTAQVDPEALGMNQAAEITTAEGDTSFVFEYTEANLNNVLLPAIVQELPPEFEGQVELTGIDLLPSALVVNGNFDTGILGAQPLEITVAVGPDEKTLDIVSVNVGGLSVESLGAAPLEDALQQAEDEINRNLLQIAVVSSGGEEMPLNKLFIGDDILQVVFEN